MRRLRLVKIPILAGICAVALNVAAAAPKARYTTLAQAAPNALNAEDRFRDRERERTHAETRRRLGDRNPELSNRKGFDAPSTDLAPDVPDTRTKSNQNR